MASLAPYHWRSMWCTPTLKPNCASVSMRIARKRATSDSTPDYATPHTTPKGALALLLGLFWLVWFLRRLAAAGLCRLSQVHLLPILTG
jgi:hypothetical protein